MTQADVIPEATGSVVITLTSAGERYAWHGGPIVWVSCELLPAIPKKGAAVAFGPFKTRCIAYDSPRHFVVLERIDP